MIDALVNGQAELHDRMVSIHAAIERLRVETAAAMEHSVTNMKRIAGAMDAEIAKVQADVQDLIGAPPEPAREPGEPAVQFRQAAE